MQEKNLPIEWMEWTEKFLSHNSGEHVAPMDNTVSKALVHLLLAEKLGLDSITLEKEFSRITMYQIIKSRLESLHAAVDVEVAMFLVSLSCGLPGTAVMWCHAMKRLSMDKGVPVSLTILCEQWPNGFPTEKTLQMLWQAQKTQKGYNLLDSVHA